MGIGNPPGQPEYFRMVPDRLWADERIHHLDVRVWCVLNFIARGRDQCEATNTSLATKLRVSERAIRESLLRLERAEFITRRREGHDRVIALQPHGDGQPVFTLKVAAG